MIVRLDRSSLKQTTWSEYAIRFAFGGLITAAAGLIGREWGPVVAGLFLAFPAIFPASATIVEKHERERKQLKGMHGRQRGIFAAADDAMGATLGSAGLLVFAVITWLCVPYYSALIVLPCASLGWFVTSGLLWMLRKRGRRFLHLNELW
ncbi:MAG TPA: DUF3147 family protein [Bryobacteraceae bacterium]|nr:DUF3147 family protein [Bryobacteraceae bacterium]